MAGAGDERHLGSRSILGIGFAGEPTYCRTCGRLPWIVQGKWPISPGVFMSENSEGLDTERDSGAAARRKARRDAINEELAVAEATIPSQLDRWDRERVRPQPSDGGDSTS